MRRLLFFIALSFLSAALTAADAKPPRKNPTQLAQEKAAKEKEAAIKAELAARKKAADAKAAKELADKENAAADSKNWKPQDYLSLQSLNQLICVYIKDEKGGKFAEELERNGLGNDKVKAALKPFTRIKIKSDGSDAKNYPPAWMQQAEKGGALVLASSDLRFVLFIDSTSNKGAVSAQQIIENAGKVTQADFERKSRPAGEAAIPGLDTAASKKPTVKKTTPMDE